MMCSFYKNLSTAVFLLLILFIFYRIFGMFHVDCTLHLHIQKIDRLKETNKLILLFLFKVENMIISLVLYCLFKNAIYMLPVNKLHHLKLIKYLYASNYYVMHLKLLMKLHYVGLDAFYV